MLTVTIVVRTTSVRERVSARSDARENSKKERQRTVERKMAESGGRKFEGLHADFKANTDLT